MKFLLEVLRAIQPETTNFREFPEWAETEGSKLPKDKKIAMFCTGGIRCEKASSLLKDKGFEKVYHLKGGILNYLEKVKLRNPSGMENVLCLMIGCSKS